MKLAIISGVSGKLGRTYAERLMRDKQTRVIGIARHEDSESCIETLIVDLTDQGRTESALGTIDLKGIDEIIYIHAVGGFKFEEKIEDCGPEVDTNDDGIDDEVYSSNVETCRNVVSILYKKAHDQGIPLCIGAFGSVSDRYHVPFWHSYSASKDILRKELRALSAKDDAVGVTFIDVNTVCTGNEERLRPNGKKQYWLSVEEVVDRSLTHITEARGYTEITIFKNDVPVDPAWYQRDRVLARWKSQMPTS
ncbi:MAG: hypothetical protein ABIJ21_00245 [Nanoarchaeota archaeon]